MVSTPEHYHDEKEDQRMTGEQALASSTQLLGGVIDGSYVDAPFP
jgi:hypothetical protein